MSIRRNFTKRQKLIAGAVVAAFILVIVYAITVSIQRSGKIKTTVKFAPYRATVKLNDTRISNNATVWLEPGDYHLTVSLDEHLESNQEDITISQDYNAIIGTLGALDEEGEKYINSHFTDYIDAEGFISNVLNEEGSDLRKTYPILNYLPINNSLYSISYEEADDHHPIIHVKTDLENLDTAVAKLQSLDNVELSTLDLNFDLDSPLGEPKDNPLQNPTEFIKAAFSLPGNYKIVQKEKTDDYFCGIIYVSNYEEDFDYAHYRIVLEKGENNNWAVPFAPQPLFTVNNTDGFTAEQLNTINSY